MRVPYFFQGDLAVNKGVYASWEVQHGFTRAAPEEEEILPSTLLLAHLQWKMLYKRKVLPRSTARKIIVNRITGTAVHLFGTDQTVNL
jgi:hypothetical protein